MPQCGSISRISQSYAKLTSTESIGCNIWGYNKIELIYREYLTTASNYIRIFILLNSDNILVKAISFRLNGCIAMLN